MNKFVLKFTIPVFIFSALIFPEIGFTQDILIDDIVGIDMPEAYYHFIDSLEYHGAIVHFRSVEGWANLINMDLVWLCNPDYEYDAASIAEIIGYSEHGGNILMLAAGDPYNSVFNAFLLDSRWNPKMEVEGRCSLDCVYLQYIFENFTNGWYNICLSEPTCIKCGDHCYPFAFSDSSDFEPVAAVSYPYKDEENCSSIVVLITGTHDWKVPYIHNPEQHRFGTNLLLGTLSVPGYELEPCAVPEPFMIQVDSCPNCANPGDTITLTGNNLWQGSNENIGGDIEIYIGETVIIPIEYSDYAPNCSTLTNTWLKFICPELPDGNYFIQLGHKAILFDGGEIQIPCEADYEPNTCMAHPLPFSPNNDGINDYCKFEYPGMSEDNGVVSIFNLDNTLVREVRNGDVQYSSKGTIYWDGKDSEGNVVNNGVYIYLVKVGSKIVCNGTVYVVR